jgi:hypothetical protein
MLLTTISVSGLASNVGLLDARNTGRTFYGLRKSFRPVELFDMFSMIEEICLREKIVLVGKWDRIPREFRDSIQPFVDAKVFELVVEPTILHKVANPGKRIMGAASIAGESNLTSATTEDASYAVARLLGAEVKFKVPALPLLGYLQHYSLMRRPLLDHAICDLAGQYSDLRNLAEEAVWQRACCAGLKHVSVPPIALEILKSCRSIDQVVVRTLEMRSDFADLRQEMTHLSDILSDPGLSPEKHLQFTHAWQRRWQELTDGTLGNSTSFGISDLTLLSGGYEIGSALASGNYFNAIMSGLRLLNQGQQLLRRQLFRPVRTPVRNYLRTTRTDMCMTVARIFDLDPKRAEHLMGLVASSNDNVWRMLCETVRASSTDKVASTRRLSA